MVLIAIISFGGLVGFAMGWGALSPKKGCASLFVVPILILFLIILEPIVTGERQSSTASFDIFFGGLYAGLAAAIGALVGFAANRISNWKR